MKQQIKHGAMIDVLTPDEFNAAMETLTRRDAPRRIRAPLSVVLDAAGNGVDNAYETPFGFEVGIRRVTLDLSTATDPSTGNVPLNVAGRSVEYLRSDTRIEFGNPQGPGGISQVPGTQTWGAEQGPYLRNGEVFGVRVRGLTPNATLTVIVEGVSGRIQS